MGVSNEELCVRDPATGRNYQWLAVDRPSDLGGALEMVTPAEVVLVWWQEQWWRDTAEVISFIDEYARVLDMRCLQWALFAGPGSELVHDVLDETIVGDGDDPFECEAMTTWHELGRGLDVDDKENEQELSYFFTRNTGESPLGLGQAAVIRVGPPVASEQSVKQWLVDPEAFAADYLSE